MKLKQSLVFTLLALVLSAVVVIAAPVAQSARPAAGSLAIPADGTTTTGQPATGTFTITSFKKVHGVVMALGNFSGSVGGQTVSDARKHPGHRGQRQPAQRRRHGRGRPAGCGMSNPRPDARAAASRPARAGGRPQPGAPSDHCGTGIGQPAREPPLLRRRTAGRHAWRGPPVPVDTDHQPAQPDSRPALRGRRHAARPCAALLELPGPGSKNRRASRCASSGESVGAARARYLG